MLERPFEYSYREYRSPGNFVSCTRSVAGSVRRPLGPPFPASILFVGTTVPQSDIKHPVAMLQLRPSFVF